MSVVVNHASDHDFGEFVQVERRVETVVPFTAFLDTLRDPARGPLNLGQAV